MLPILCNQLAGTGMAVMCLVTFEEAIVCR